MFWIRPILAGLLPCSLALAGEPVVTPRPVPLTRPEMKQLLEDMKSRPQRIPLPELTEAERAELGDRADNYESRLRYHYLPPGESSVFGSVRGSVGGNRDTAPRDFTRNADDNMSLSYQFKTKLFWIVSRTNNCQYCLGHQEQKLAATGMTDDDIAALDCDWGRYPPAEQAAFAYARKLTYEPHRLSAADFDLLRSYYTDLQILEMTLSVAGNNAINRWKEGTGVPQSPSGIQFFARAGNLPADRPLPVESFLTPTSPQYQHTVSLVAPLQRDETTGQATRQAVSSRPPLEPRDAVEAALEQARQRAPRLPLLDESATRAALGDLVPPGPVPHWLRLLANFPNEARGRVRSLRALEEDRGDLSPVLKAQVSWIIARQDRAWYATGVAQRRLRELGQSADQIYALDGNWQSFSQAERALFHVARRLAATPIALTDDDVAEALHRAGPRQVVQLIHFVTSRAYFDRVTEAAALPLEP